MSLSVFLVLQEAIRAYAEPEYRSRLAEIGGEWSRYLFAKYERNHLQKKSISGQFLSSLALLMMIVGISFVVVSKHQLGLAAWPLSTHGTWGAATIAVLVFKVFRMTILPLCFPFQEQRHTGSCMTRALAVLLFLMAYTTAFVGIGELYRWKIWSGKTLVAFVSLMLCSLAIESTSTLLSLCLWKRSSYQRRPSIDYHRLRSKRIDQRAYTKRRGSDSSVDSTGSSVGSLMRGLDHASPIIDSDGLMGFRQGDLNL